jgi:glycosyltransferase involved in cell wall biosynthesis
MENGVSVVVASFSGEAALRRCLESLEPQTAEAEVIVAAEVESAAVVRLQARFPRLVFVRAPRGTSVFRLRAMGLERARGRLVVLTEDHCTAAPGWLDALLALHREGHAVVGGPVENGLTKGPYDWALYLCEYAAHMPPLRDGPVPALSGVNVAYERELLTGCAALWQEAFYENEVHDALRASGHRLQRSGRAAVSTHLSLPFREAAAHLFRGGQRFGRYRHGRSSPAVRAILPVAALAVPALLTWRVVRAVAARRPERLGAMARGLGYVVAFNSAWAAGEALGYLRPVPGPGAEALAGRR